MATQIIETIPSDSVGIQVPVGRSPAGAGRCQTVFDARDRSMAVEAGSSGPTRRIEEW